MEILKCRKTIRRNERSEEAEDMSQERGRRHVSREKEVTKPRKS